jgi:hypothetical protein
MTGHTNGKTNNAGLTFFPVFRHSGISIFHTVKIAEKLDFILKNSVFLPQGYGTFAGSGSVTRGFRIRVHIRKLMKTLTKTIKKGVIS